MSTGRALITGASGLLGRALMKEFEASDRWDVLGLAYSRARGNLKKVDITVPSQVQAVIEEFNPTVIIHAAAERRPDKVDKEEAATKELNVTATENICKIAAKKKIIVVYISTDYVFDGTNAPYSEDATPNPLNKYGSSKLDGEKATMDASPGNIVLRVPILYGPVEKVEESAVTILFSAVKASTEPTTLSHYERRFPTDTRDVAGVVRQLLDKREEDPSLTGYFHFSSEDNMTKYDMAMAMAEVFSIPATHITADSKATPGAPRPYDAHLDSSRLDKLGIGTRTPFRDGISSVLAKYVDKYY